MGVKERHFSCMSCVQTCRQYTLPLHKVILSCDLLQLLWGQLLLLLWRTSLCLPCFPAQCWLRSFLGILKRAPFVSLLRQCMALFRRPLSGSRPSRSQCILYSPSTFTSFAHNVCMHPTKIVWSSIQSCRGRHHTLWGRSPLFLVFRTTFIP